MPVESNAAVFCPARAHRPPPVCPSFALQLPKGGDDNWLTKMHDTLSEKEHYEKPRLSRTAFVIKHYADNVAYEVNGFMEKNKVCCWG